MRGIKATLAALSVLAISVAALPAQAYTEDKGARIDRLTNDDNDGPSIDHGPKVSDPTAKALDGKPAFKEKLAAGPVRAPSYEVSQSDDRLILEPPPEAPLNGGIKLD